MPAIRVEKEHLNKISMKPAAGPVITTSNFTKGVIAPYCCHCVSLEQSILASSRALENICRSRCQQRRCFDHGCTGIDFDVGDEVGAFMPRPFLLAFFCFSRLPSVGTVLHRPEYCLLSSYPKHLVLVH
jgi:hypothetical protein